MKNCKNCLWAGGAAVAMAVSAGGCASPFADRYEESSHRRESLRLAAAGARELPTATQPAKALDAGGAAAGAGPEGYVREALARNPRIAAARQAVERMKQREPQERSLEDPMLEVTPVGEMAETPAGMVGVMTSVSQALPLPGKLAAKGRAARFEAGEAAAELAQTRLEVAAEVRRAYWGLYEAARGLEALKADAELMRQFQQVRRGRYEWGAESQADMLRATVEVSQLESRLLALQQQRTAAGARLNSLLDRPVDAELPAPAAAAEAEAAAGVEAEALNLEGTPRLAAIEQRREAYRQRLKLAKLERFPDLRVSFSYNTVDKEGMAEDPSGKDQWWVGFGINIPLWQGRREAAEREAIHGILQSSAELASERNEIAYDVREAATALEAQRRQAQLLLRTVLPAARQTVQSTAANYQAGSVEFFELVDAWRSLLEFELMYHQTVAGIGRSDADLRRAAGVEAVAATDEVKHDE